MTLERRRFVAGMFCAAQVLRPRESVRAASVLNAPLDNALFQGILDAGDWSATADDNGGKERIPEPLASAMARQGAIQFTLSRALAPPALGLLVLTLSVAEWGVAWSARQGTPTDPAKTGWKGPSSIEQGKHLMSYALGGIGLPHLDTGGAVRLFTEISKRIPQAAADLQRLAATKGGFNFDAVRAAGGVCGLQPARDVVMTDLEGVPFKHDAVTLDGQNYCEAHDLHGRLAPEDWRALRTWCRKALRRRDMQEWIVQDWLDTVWTPSYHEVMARPQGSLKEALVVARIWSTSKGAALQALQAAGSERDPGERVKAELARYAYKDATHESRLGLMQRPGIVLDHFSRI